MKKAIFPFMLFLLCIWMLPHLSYADTNAEYDFVIGDEVVFGHYLQNINSNETQPIEWVVLDNSKNRIKLLSKKVLEVMPFHNQYNGAYWPKSDLRKWLNNDFFKDAFSKDEQKAIISTSQTWYIYDNELRTKAQKTNDKVTLLSISEASDYFIDENTKRSIFGYYSSTNTVKNSHIKATKDYYMAEITTYANRDYMPDKMTPVGMQVTESWWLCDTYAEREFASYTGVRDSRFFVNYERVMNKHGVRPVITIDIRKAGKDVLKKKVENDNSISSVSSEKITKNSTVLLNINVDFEPNYLFSKYDVSLYVDNEHLCDLRHGRDGSAKLRVSKGKHTICFYKKDDHNIATRTDVNISEHSYMECEISTNRNGINLNNIKTISRYEISDLTMQTYLREYDSIVDQLALEYDLAYHRREHSGRVSYEDVFFLLNTNSNKALCFIVPKHIYEDNPVRLGYGQISGSVSSGSVTLVMEGGNIIQLKTPQSSDISSRVDEFNFVCGQLIRYAYPEVYKKYGSVESYLAYHDIAHFQRILAD